MTKIGVNDAAYMVKAAMDRLEATAEGKQSVKIDEIDDKDLRALAETATTGSGDRVTLRKLRETLKAIGTELTNVDKAAHGGDGDGKLDYGEAAKLSPLAARMLDWAVDGQAMSGGASAVMWVQPKDIEDATRQVLAMMRKELPSGRGKVKLSQVQGNEVLEALVRGAAERVSAEGPQRTVTVNTSCGGTATGTEPEISVQDALDEGVPRAKLREIVTDAKSYLSDDVMWADPREGYADIGNQRYAMEDYAYGANDDYGAGTSGAATAIFDVMASAAEKGHMRPTQEDLDALAAAAVSSGC